MPPSSSSAKPDEPALVTALFSRRLAEPFARLAVRLGISADAVTVAGGLCWMASLPLAPLAGLRVSCGAPDGPWLWAACAALWCLGYELDVVDGSVARLTGTSSRAGFFLDCVFHYLFKPAFLFSVGLGILLGLGYDSSGTLGAALAALAVLSLPANGSATTSAAELALCEEVAAGHLRPDGAARPALWLGSADVADPAAAKRRTPLRTAKTLVQETLSYYLQAPFFALLVAADFVLHFTVRGTVVCDRTPLVEAAYSWRMPITGAGFAAVAALLALRIPLRLAGESRRLGRPTRAGRAGRILARLSALCTALGAAGLIAVTIAERVAPPVDPLLFFAPFALLLLGAALRALAARATRRAGSPVHNRYLLRAFDLLLAPTVVGALALLLAAMAVFDSVLLVNLCLAPLAAAACRPVASETLAHVLCQETGKGRLRPGDPAPWDDPAPRPAAFLPLLPPVLLLVAVVDFWFLYGLEDLLSEVAFPLFALALPASLPGRIGRVRRRLRASAAAQGQPARSSSCSNVPSGADARSS